MACMCGNPRRRNPVDGAVSVSTILALGAGLALGAAAVVYLHQRDRNTQASAPGLTPTVAPPPPTNVQAPTTERPMALETPATVSSQMAPPAMQSAAPPPPPPPVATPTVNLGSPPPALNKAVFTQPAGDARAPARDR